VEKRFGVAAPSKSRVHVEAGRSRGDELEDLREEHGHVLFRLLRSIAIILSALHS
jgi:hypothetical protein